MEILNKIINYTLGSKCYKIVRVFTVTGFISISGVGGIGGPRLCYRDIRQSCYLPFNHSNAVIYKDGVWVKGDDLFIYGKEENMEELKYHVEMLADSFSVVDKHELKKSYFKNSHFELWECRVGKIQKLYGRIFEPRSFLRDPESGKTYKSIAKSFTDNTYTRNLPCQLVTNKVKLTKKVFEYISTMRTIE